MSDHFPTLVLLKQIKLTDKEPLEFLSRKLTDGKIDQVKEELNIVDWNEVLNSDNLLTNCKAFSNILESTLIKVAPL